MKFIFDASGIPDYVLSMVAWLSNGDEPGRYSEGFAGILSKKPRKTTKSLASTADVPDGTGTGAFRIQTSIVTATPTWTVIVPCVLRCGICFRRRNLYLHSSAADLSHP